LVFDQAAAAVTAAAMIAGAPGVQQPCPPVSDGGDDSQSVVASMLPNVYILGRCCIGWSQQLLAIACTAPSCGLGGQFLVRHSVFEQPGALQTVQQWLEASSTQEQLGVAGYAPTTLQQQLQQLTAVIQAVDDSTVSVDSQREYYLGDSSHLQEVY
jgi:hypothetical protein